MAFILSTILSICSFFNDYSSETYAAINYIKSHTEIRTSLEKQLGAQRATCAISVVAPEIAMFSKLEDIVEYKILSMFYIQSGEGDFSIGIFQMKPSFAVELENNIEKSKFIRKKYSNLLIKDTNIKRERKTRIERLCSTNWQCLYLSAFIEYTENRITEMGITQIPDKVKYWATLYNSGMSLSKSAIQNCLTKQLFPRFWNTHNYAEVSLEFYNYLCH